jgi:uncharacterized protein YqeY
LQQDNHILIMSLKERIEADIKKAMLAREKDELRALRSIKSMILLAETEKGKAGELTPETEMKILQKAVKQRSDSIALYREQNRNDLADTEQGELEIIKQYLPEQISTEFLRVEVEKIIAEVGAQSMKDMGRVMGLATKSLAGRVDNKSISEMVKELLS